MARVGIRDLPDHIYEAICESAEKNNRSIEGEVRAILQTYVSTLEPEPAPNQTLLRISEHRDRPFRLIVTGHFANA